MALPDGSAGNKCPKRQWNDVPSGGSPIVLLGLLMIAGGTDSTTRQLGHFRSFRWCHMFLQCQPESHSLLFAPHSRVWHSSLGILSEIRVETQFFDFFWRISFIQSEYLQFTIDVQMIQFVFIGCMAREVSHLYKICRLRWLVVVIWLKLPLRSWSVLNYLR